MKILFSACLFLTFSASSAMFVLLFPTERSMTTIAADEKK